MTGEPCQKLGLVTRNQAGNESIDGLEAESTISAGSWNVEEGPSIEAECTGGTK